MLAIRLQRVGRKGYPVYRVAVQEAWRHPSSGRVVAYVGSYNPHTKEANIQKEAAQKYLDNGAQPSPRVVKLLEDAGVKLPKWVEKAATDKQKAIRNAEKLRKNQPKEEPVAEEPAQEAPAEEAPAEETATEVVEPEEAPATEEAEKAE
ncbi:MAG TPA: 30S ribosomal protein S16 [Candidatus Saccharibacteria bacterium]|nr:30S ribosomal protein S16 [Candidatus Saccharibacteria bacterium]